MARFSDLIPPSTPAEAAASGASVGWAAPVTSSDEVATNPVTDHVATHDEVTAALSALVEPSSGPVVDAPVAAPGEPAPDPAAALAAAFRTELPDADPIGVATGPPATPVFDDDLLPARVAKPRRR